MKNIEKARAYSLQCIQKNEEKFTKRNTMLVNASKFMLPYSLGVSTAVAFIAAVARLM